MAGKLLLDLLTCFFSQIHSSRHWTLIDFFRVETNLLIFAYGLHCFLSILILFPFPVMESYCFSIWPLCVLCGTPLNSSQVVCIRNAFQKVIRSMGWGVEWWEIEVQSPMFNRGHIHKNVSAALFIIAKHGSNPNTLFWGVDGIVTIEYTIEYCIAVKWIDYSATQ